MEQKIQKLMKRMEEVEGLLMNPSILSDKKRYREMAQEHSYLSEVKNAHEALEKASKELAENKELLAEEKDSDFAQVLREEIESLGQTIQEKESKLQNLLVPPDPNDHKNTIIELRAGTGGDEASLFVSDCVRMYKMFSDKMGWRYELLSATPSEIGGFKEYVMVVSGSNVYRFLRHEGGTHRVQRVPETEAQGRVHTSAITIAVLLEPSEEAEVRIDEKELRVDTFRSSGAGGQHVNTTDSAVRLTHIPTGIAVECQQERSQHKNKEKAMRLLKAKIAEEERKKKQIEIAEHRATQVGSGDRSERIRTYNFPQNRVTDHRINMTKYNLNNVMEGELEDFCQALVAYYHQQQLESDS
jgi:peptide chain release factor 1